MALEKFCTWFVAFLFATNCEAQSFEVSAYTGFQTSPNSNVSFEDGTGSGLDFKAGWHGKSFTAPPYYGLRGMVWTDRRWGFGAEFTHAKVYADNQTLLSSGFQTLEFSDGINILTANVFYRWQSVDSRFTPYFGGGIGVSIPHVEVKGNGIDKFEYQLTGPAMRLVGGVSYMINEELSVFGEYNATYSQNEADLGSGATIQTDIITNALNLGMVYRF